MAKTKPATKSPKACDQCHAQKRCCKGAVNAGEPCARCSSQGIRCTYDRPPQAKHPEMPKASTKRLAQRLKKLKTVDARRYTALASEILDAVPSDDDDGPSDPNTDHHSGLEIAAGNVAKRSVSVPAADFREQKDIDSARLAYSVARGAVQPVTEEPGYVDLFLQLNASGSINWQNLIDDDSIDWDQLAGALKGGP
ncbi:hypothetical protein IWX49DRAFT_595295 [Phyllosticta citricarpa]